MFKRFELHNHTTESDAGITCRELADIMEKDSVDVFALTDHNTVSGHPIMKRLLAEGHYRTKAIYGMEYTTYYGHIICPILEQYVPWDAIDRRHPEKLFEACQASGALTGVAHPFSYGAPFAKGCRFEMEISDYAHVDFIEIINNAQTMQEVNRYGIRMWEELILQGEKLAATSGMDLHRPRDMGGCYATYLEGETDGDPVQELKAAIKAQRTWVSSGMLLTWQEREDGVHFRLVDAKKPDYPGTAPYFMTLTGQNETKTFSIGAEGLTVSLAQGTWIPKLYTGTVSLERLVCISPVIYTK